MEYLVGILAAVVVARCPYAHSSLGDHLEVLIDREVYTFRQSKYLTEKIK